MPNSGLFAGLAGLSKEGRGCIAREGHGWEESEQRRK